MVTNTVVNVDMQAKGLDKMVKDSAQVNTNLQNAANAASKTGARPANQTAAYKAGMEGAIKPDELAGYGVARSTVGTGAASRDFAKQAQGLGGLVHLYATFAANLFAVSAAFNALSKAMDTTNMVKGLDQLGAASGRNLGTLSKRVAEAAEGAISLRESIEAVSKASSAGMSSKQILQMAEVAKKASQALGVNMGDAVSRLTRGISKLEPELLDELGIMTKVGKATEDYARSVGKATSELTDFEKRQAYANAVLKEGLDKFSSIQIDVNPYSKLLASMQNILQVGLEIVNKVLAPIAKLLADSPVALTAALASVAAILVKQAIPALGAFRENMEKSAESARKLAVARNKASRDAHVESLEQIKKQAEERANEELRATQDTYEKLAQITSKKKFSKTISPIFEKDATQITDKDLALFDKLANSKRATPASSKFYKDAKEGLEAWRAAEIALQQKIEETTKSLEARNSSLSVAGQLARSAEKANQEAVSRQIKSSTSAVLYTEGLVAAYKKLNAEIKAARSGPRQVDFGAGPETVQRMSALNAGWTRLTGLIGLAGQAMTIFAGAIQTAMFYVGAFVVAFQILDGLFGTAEKELDKFNSSMDNLAESSANAKRTLAEVYSPKNISADKAVRDISSISNAFEDLSNSISTSVEDLKLARREMGAWTTMIDSIKSIWGGGTSSITSGIKKAVESSEKLANAQGKGGEFRQKLAQALGTADTSMANILAKINSTPEALDKVVKVANDFSKELRASEQVFVSINEKLAIGEKLLQEFSNELLPQDKIGKIGIQTLSLGQDLAKLIAMPANEAIKELALISKDAAKLTFVDPKNAQVLAKMSVELNNIVEQGKKLESEKSNLQDLQKAAADRYSKAARGQPIDGINYRQIDTKEFRDARAELQRVQNLPKVIDKQIADNKAEAASLLSKFQNVALDSLAHGAQQIQRSIGIAFDRAGIALAKAELQGPSGRGDAAAMNALMQKDLELQKEQISTGLKIVESQNRLADEIEKARLQEAVLYGKDKETRDAAQKALDILNAKISLRSENKNVSSITALISNRGASDIQRQAASALLPELQKTEAGRAQMLGVDAQKRAEALKSQQATLKENFDYTQKINTLEQQSLAALNEYSTILFSIVGYSTEYSIAIQTQYETEALLNKQLQERKAIELEIAQLRLAKGSDKKISDREVELGQIKVRQEEELNNLRLKNSIAQATQSSAQFQRELEFRNKILGIQTQTSLTGITVSEAILNSFKQLGTASDEYLASEEAILNTKKLQYDYASKLRDVESEAAISTNKLQNQRSVISSSVTGEVPTAEQASALKEIDAQLAKVNETKQKGIELANASFDAQNKIIKITKQTALEQAAYNKELERMSSISDSLAVVFGDIGKKLGDGFTGAIKASKKFTDTQAKLAKDRASNLISEDQLKKKTTQNELEYAGDVIGATKNIFSEKTAAYKVLAATEKAIHIAKLAMMVQEVAATFTSEASKTAATEAGFLARSTTYISEIFAKFTSMLGPYGMAAAAVAVAAIFGGGGGKKVNTAGMTAEDRQSTQGTGMEWRDGKKVETGRGVFGDSGAKSESIAKSIEVIKNTSVEGLTYSNKMLDALNGIKDAIAGTAKSLYSITGIRTGSAFGTAESQKSTSGIVGLFGKTTSKDIIDSGIKLSGTFGQLSTNAKNAVSQYETLLTTVKKSGFLGIGSSTSTSVSENVKSADAQVTSAIEKIFSNATKLFTSVGAEVGMSAQEISSKLSQIPVSVTASLKGLSGADLEKEFSAIIGSVLDDAAAALFSNLQKYQEFGEGLLETVIRVTDSNKKVKLALDSIGKTYESISYDVSESLVKMMGGIENFLDQVSKYKDTFLTDAEKLNPIRSSVAKTMAELGYATVDTRAEFKALVNSIDVTSTEGQKLFKSLMEISDAFGQVTAKHQELLDEYVSLENELLSKFKNNADVKAEIARREVKDMTDLEKAQFLANKTLQDQIDYLEQYYGLADDLVRAQEDLLSEADKLIAVRNRERSALAAANQPVYNLIKAYEDLKSANETMKSSLASMQSSLSSIASAAEAAANRLKSAGQALATGYKSAQDRSTNAQKATQSAMSSIAKGYLSAKAAVVAASAKITDAQNQAAKALRDTLRQLSVSIRDFIIQTSTSELGINTPAQNVAALQSQFDSLLSAARGGDTTAMGKLTDVSQQLLTASKEQASSAMDYARTYGKVIGGLDEISNAAAAMAGPAEDDTQSQILAGITELNAANDDLLIWQKAINDTGIDANKFAETTQSTVDDLLKTLQEAKAEQLAADADTSLWQEKLATAGIDTAKFTESTAANIDKLIKEYQDAFAANAQAQADLLEAQKLTKDYTFETASELKTLRSLAEQYEAARALAAKSQQVIDTTNTQAIVDAINNLANSIINKSAETGPTVKITDPISTTVQIQTAPPLDPTTAGSFAASNDPNFYTDKYMGGWKWSDIAQFDEGTNQVPKTGLAIIHKDEKIQPRGYSNEVDQALLEEVKALKEEVAKLRMVNENTEYNTRKSKDMLQQVTQGNDYVITKAAA